MDSQEAETQPLKNHHQNENGEEDISVFSFHFDDQEHAVVSEAVLLVVGILIVLVIVLPTLCGISRSIRKEKDE